MIRFDGLSPEEHVDQRRPYVEATRAEYRSFWEDYVRLGGAEESVE